MITSPRTDRIRKLVVESGAKQLDQWLDYERDIRADYERAFGEAPGALVGIGHHDRQRQHPLHGAGLVRPGALRWRPASATEPPSRGQSLRAPLPVHCACQPKGNPAVLGTSDFALLASTRLHAPSRMFAFILRRLIQAVVVMVAVAFIAFLLFQYVGDPVVFLLGQDATPEQIRELRADLGLDKPFFVQFWHFLVNAAQGEFGLSLRQGAKVSRLIAERFPATLELALVAAAAGAG